MTTKIIKLALVIGLIFILGKASANIAGAETDEPLFSGKYYVLDEILVKFKPGVSATAKERTHRRLGAISHKNSYGNYYQAIKTKEGMVEKMVELYLHHPLVEYAEPNYILKACFAPNDPLYSFQWHFSLINMESAWDKSTGSGITVAVLDSGVNPGGKDGFGGRLVPGYNTINSWKKDFTVDNNGHGTHVAGTIAQETNNGIGVAGVAYNASIMPVKVLNRKGNGSLKSITDGIRWAADNGADIINMSLSGPNYSQTLEDAINYAYNLGVLPVAATGNEGGHVGYPAACQNCMAVGAVRNDKQVTLYSNWGPEVDVVAPGGDTGVDQAGGASEETGVPYPFVTPEIDTDDINLNGDGYPDGILQESFDFFFFGITLGWNYFYYQGTSMACPHVAGIAALILSLHPTYTPFDIKSAMTSTAEDLGSPGKDDYYGWGLVDSNAALLY